MPLGGLGAEVHGNGVEREIREVDTGGDGSLAAEALLAMSHLVTPLSSGVRRISRIR
jgi:hypothetical protein